MRLRQLAGRGRRCFTARRLLPDASAEALTRWIPLFTSLAFISALSGCASTLPPKLTSEVPDNPLSQECKGLVLSADPIVEVERLERYFGADLSGVDVVPVLIRAEGRGTSDNYLIRPEDICIRVLSDSMAGAPDAPETPLNEAATAAEISAESWGEMLSWLDPWAGGYGTPTLYDAHLFPPAIGLPIIGLSVVQFVNLYSAQRHEKVFDYNWKEKALPEKTVYPGTTVSGFVYFPISYRDTGRSFQVVVKATEMSTGQALAFVFRFAGGRRDG